jgi:hypothetical protein
MWFITRFASPYFAVNSLFLLGWITTGVTAFYIARKLRLPVSFSMACGLLVQTLPWFREKLTAHTSFMYISIPLFVILVSLNLLENRTKKSIFFVASLLAGSAFFDMYLFYMSIVAVGFLVLFSYFSRIKFSEFLRKHALTAAGLIIVLCIFYYLFISVVMPLTARGGTRQVVIVDRSFLDIFSGSIFDFIVPDRHHWLFPQNWDEQGGLRWGFRDTPLENVYAQDVPNYLGIPVVVMLIVSFLPRVNRLLLRDVRILRALAVFLFALSVRTLTFGSYAIPAPSAGFKYIFPGARVFSRFALLAEPIAVIVAIYVVFTLSHKLKAHIFRSLFAVGFILVVLLDFHPTNNREYRKDEESFAVFNTKIASTGGGVLILSNIVHGVILGPTVNGISEDWKSLIIGNSEGSSLAAYLASLDVNYVVTDKDANFSPSNLSLGAPQRLNLEESRFPLISTLDYGNVRYELRGVKPQPGDSFCLGCLPYSLFVDYGFIDHATTMGGVSWVTERRLDLKISPEVQLSEYRLRMVVSPPFGGFAQPRSILIEVGETIRSFQINPPYTAIEFDVSEGDLVRISDFNKCVKPSELEVGNPDSRCLLYGLNKIEVVDTSRPVKND